MMNAQTFKPCALPSWRWSSPGFLFFDSTGQKLFLNKRCQVTVLGLWDAKLVEFAQLV